MDPRNILKKHSGDSAFPLHREALIESVLAKKAAFVLMPAGAGKSICLEAC